MVALLLLLAAAPPRPIAGPGEASQICLGTRPAARFSGPPEEREGFLERRRRILAAKFEATVPLSELLLSDVDEDERRLWYMRPGPLRTREGVTLFVQQRRLELAATDAVPRSEHAMSRLAAGQEKVGGFRFTYELADPDGAGPCPAGARPGGVPVLSVRLIALVLVDGRGTIVAKGEGDDAPEERAPPGGKPSVEVAPATVDGPGPRAEVVTEKTRAREPALTACFSEALSRDPTVDGSIVFRLAIDRKGKVKEAEIAADTVQDEPLTACARKVLAALELGKGGPSDALVPVHFERN